MPRHKFLSPAWLAVKVTVELWRSPTPQETARGYGCPHYRRHQMTRGDYLNRRWLKIDGQRWNLPR